MNLSIYDVIIGSDFDGYSLNLISLPPYYVINAGLLADIIPYESEENAEILKELAGLEKINLLKAKKIIVPSEYSKRKVTELYSLDVSNLAVVPLGVNLEELTLQPVHESKSGGIVKILCVAKQYPRKGISDLIKIFSQLVNDRLPVFLDIVGGGPELENNLDLIDRYNLKNQIMMHGDIDDRSKIFSLYQKADIFCLPSYHETFGLVFLEAMASGLPVICYNSSAVPEVVPDNCGILCQTGDTKELKSALFRLIQNPELRRNLAKNGLNYAQQMTWEKSAQKILNLIEKK
jgi:glycosyltransferase involved in cell wall biosynthesis